MKWFNKTKVPSCPAAPAATVEPENAKEVRVCLKALELEFADNDRIRRVAKLMYLGATLYGKAAFRGETISEEDLRYAVIGETA